MGDGVGVGWRRTQTKRTYTGKRMNKRSSKEVELEEEEEETGEQELQCEQGQKKAQNKCTKLKKSFKKVTFFLSLRRFISLRRQNRKEEEKKESNN